MATGKQSKPELTWGRLVELLDYEPSITGHFFWRVNKGRSRAGSLAGWTDSYGYRVIQIDGRNHKAHRLAWFYMTKQWPPEDIDHINGRPGDDIIANLRLATRGQNHANRRLGETNTSGLKGVVRRCDGKKWVAQIQYRKKNYYLGSFATKRDAHAAYAEAAIRFFGRFARSQ